MTEPALVTTTRDSSGVEARLHVARPFESSSGTEYRFSLQHVEGDATVVIHLCDSRTGSHFDYWRYRDRLRELMALQDDWDGYGAPAPSRWVYWIARFILDAIADIALEPDRIVPSAAGGLAFYFPSHDSQKAGFVEILNSGEVVGLLEDRPSNRRQADILSLAEQEGDGIKLEDWLRDFLAWKTS